MAKDAPHSENTREMPFDLEQALGYMDGDRTLFQELVGVFLEESVKQLKEIKEAIARGDCHLVERTSHSIKGSLSTFAAKRATEAARTLEFLGRDGKIEEFPQAMKNLEHELSLLREALIKVSST